MILISFSVGKILTPLVNVINCELVKITDWFKANKLSLNIKKTHLILFHAQNKQIESTSSIKIDDTEVIKETSTKFLRVMINQSLMWNDHISVIVYFRCPNSWSNWGPCF